MWVVPLRDIWNLSNNRHLSPSLERKICCTAVETGSFEKAARLAEEWGCSIDDTTIQRCVSRLGEQTETQPLSRPCADRAGPEDTLMIMMDGWMARHRGRGWGFKKPCEGWDAVNWHEIKTAVIYCLNARVELSPKRAALLHKHVVATPANTEPLSFGKRVHHEALRMGMAQAKKVFVVMDGAVWLWNIFEDRFRSVATGTLDFYHASEHLHALGELLFESKEVGKEWSMNLLMNLKVSSPSVLMKTLADLVVDSENRSAKAIDSLQKTTAYFKKHTEHMDYGAAKADGRPIGSGSMESQCSQFQNRFKRRGQFWSQSGFASLLEISVRHQNNELRSLWAA
jgi:hypothetical protein